MGDALSFKKVQVSVFAVLAAFALGFTLFGVQAAYADEGQSQSGAILTTQNNAPGATSEQGSGASKADYTVSADGKSVAYTKVESTKKSVKIPDTITINGTKYPVTSVAANAFKGSKATKITVGKNVTKINKNAFKGAKKLKTVVLNTTKLKKAGVKGALKGSKVTTVKVPKNKVKAYKKIFTKANCGKKVTVKAK